MHLVHHQILYDLLLLVPQEDPAGVDHMTIILINAPSLVGLIHRETLEFHPCHLYRVILWDQFVRVLQDPQHFPIKIS